MELAGRLRSSEACNDLAVPGLSELDLDEDEGDLVIGIRPKSSPIPSRRSSFSDEDSDPEPPLCGSRRVSFADAKGLSLVHVKEFETWEVPKLPETDSTDGEVKDPGEYHLSPLTFSLPRPSEEVFSKVLSHKVELETIGLLPGTTIVKGVIRVLNISYDKSVYVRTSLDRWATHFDLLGEYVPGSSDGVMDSFSFKLTLGPTFGDQGVRVDFCLRYETPAGTFWANNNNRNYVLSCQRGMNEGTEPLQRDNANKKSCLKTISQSDSSVENVSSKQVRSQENMTTDESLRPPELGTLKVKRISKGQSATSNRERGKILMENKQNSSRRKQRQAARMARLRDYYTQRDAEATDAGKDKNSTETKQANPEETPGDSVVGLQPFNEGKIKSECPQLVSEVLEACGAPLPYVTHDHTATKQVKSDLAVLPQGQSASAILNIPPGEQENIREFVTASQNGERSLACPNNPATASSEIFISQSNSFNFGTVVDPLYCQAFHSVSAENRVSTGGLSETRQTCGIAPINTRSSMRKVQESQINSQESNDECLTVKLIEPNPEEQETMSKIPKCVDTVENSTKMEKELDQNGTNNSLGQQCHLGNNFLSNSVNSQIETKKEILAYGALQSQLPQQNSPLLSVKLEETLSENESKDGLKDIQLILEHVVEVADQQVTCECLDVHQVSESCKTDTSLMEDDLLQVLDELNTNQTDRYLKSLAYLCDPERPAYTLLDASLKTQEKQKLESKEASGSEKGNKSNSGDIREMIKYGVTQSIVNEVRRNNHAEMFGGLSDQKVLEKKWDSETDSSFYKKSKDFLSIDTDEEKNWEMMVEEEENDVLSNEESEQINLKRDANETAVKVKAASEVMVDITVLNEFNEVNVIMTDGTEGTDVKQINGKEVIELQNKTEMHSASLGKARVGEEEEKQASLAQQNTENKELKSVDFKEIISVSDAEEIVVTDVDSDKAIENTGDESRSFKVGSDVTQNKKEGDLFSLVSRAGKNDPMGVENVCFQTDTPLSDEEKVQNEENDIPKTNTKHPTSDVGKDDSTDEPDSASAESDSDEELQLYVHCLRDAGSPAQVLKHKTREAGFTARKIPYTGRSKPPTSMPSISEALDEEQQHTSSLKLSKEEVKTVIEARSSTQEMLNQTKWRLKDLFSCSNVSKILLYASLMVAFTVVAYHYDFLVCFLLYVISVIWLCCQGETTHSK